MKIKIALLLLVVLGVGIYFWAIHYLAYRHFDNGVAHQQNVEYIKAYNEFTQAIEYNNDFDEAYFQRAVSYSEVGRYEDASHDLEYLIAKGYKKPESMLWQCKNLLNQKKFQQGIEVCDKSYALSQSDETAYYLALGYSRLQNKIKAIEYLSLIIAKTPTSLKAIDRRGRIYADQKEFKLASIDAMRACGLGDCALVETLKARGEFIQP